MEEFRLIIAGTRTFNDYELLTKVADFTLKNKLNKKIVIVSGKAKGADSLGEKYAAEKNYCISEHPANWSLGKSAGYIRNYEMAKFVKEAKDYGCLAFWDNVSRGTKNMIEICKKENIPCIIKLTVPPYSLYMN